MSQEEMKRLAILKWEYIVEHYDGGSYIDFLEELSEAHPELVGLTNYCSYCDTYLFTNGNPVCSGCPLKDKGLDCCEEYDAWVEDSTPAAAQAMLDKIRRS
jgi:hypothetical protein